jgi:hypothetical protein
MALGLTQRLTEMSTRNLPGGKGQPARKADLTAICEPIVENVGASTSHNPIGLHGLLQGELDLILPLSVSRLSRKSWSLLIRVASQSLLISEVRQVIQILETV